MKLFKIFCAFVILGYHSANAATIRFFDTSGKIDSALWFVSDGWTDGDIQSCEWRKEAVSARHKKIRLNLSNKGGKVRPIGCGEVQTTALNSYGTYEARIKSAAGSGLNTAFFTYIGPPVRPNLHDEIDFEFLGKNPRTVQVNYYVGGKDPGGVSINLGFDASKAFHNYRFIWEPTRIRWYIDGKLVHESKAGAVMPSNPGRIFLSLWSGSKLVNKWLGPFDYKNAVSAEYAWVKFTPMKTPHDAAK